MGVGWILPSMEYLFGDRVANYDGSKPWEGVVKGLALGGSMLVFALPGRLEGPVCGPRVRVGEDPGHAGEQACGGGQDPCGLVEEATNKPDANLCVNWLGITISPLGLRWIGDTALR